MTSQHSRGGRDRFFSARSLARSLAHLFFLFFFSEHGRKVAIINDSTVLAPNKVGVFREKSGRQRESALLLKTLVSVLTVALYTRIPPALGQGYRRRS